MFDSFRNHNNEPDHNKNLRDFVYQRECQNKDEMQRRISVFLLHAAHAHGMFFIGSCFLWILGEFRYFYLTLCLLALSMSYLRYDGRISKLSEVPVAVMGISEMVLYCKIFSVMFLNFDNITKRDESGFIVVTALVSLIFIQMLWREHSIIKIFNQARNMTKREWR